MTLSAKKLISIILSTVLLVTFINVPGLNSLVRADEVEFVWYENEDGTVTITGVRDPIIYYLNIPSSIIDDDGEELVVTAIADEAFSGLERLGGVEISEGVTSIGYQAFYRCENLEAVTLPSSLESIGEEAFNGCKALKYLTINTEENPSSLTTIDDHAFSCCQLNSIEIPASVTSIGDSAFDGCEYLSSVTFMTPSSLTSIGEGAFVMCGKELDEGLNLIIPEGVTSIGYQAFFYANLRSITLPSTLTTIGSDAFDSCEFTSVTLPCSWYNNISENRFYGGTSNSFTYTHSDDCGVFNEADLFSCKYTGEELTYEPGNDDAKCSNHTLILDGSIGVAFAIKPSQNLLDCGTAYVVITLPNGTEEICYFTDDNYDSSQNAYIFTGYVAAKEMADTVTASVYCSVQGSSNPVLVNTFTYSVNQYWTDMQTDEGRAAIVAAGIDYGKLENLVACMLFYGANAQKYFDYNTDNYAYNVLSSYEYNYFEQYFSRNTAPIYYEPSAIAPLDVFDYQELNQRAGEDVCFVGVDLVLDSSTTLGLYLGTEEYTANDLTVTVSADGDTNTIEAFERDGYVYIPISNIGATQLDDIYDVKVYLNGNSEDPVLEFRYCALAYYELAYNLYNSEDSVDNFNLWVLTLYLRMYSYFANQYFG